jgi:hypothetical protein
MNDQYTLMQIAEQLLISTTTLRRYEEQELIHRADSALPSSLPFLPPAPGTARVVTLLEQLRILDQGSIGRPALRFACM